MNPNKMKKPELVTEVVALREKVTQQQQTIDDQTKAIANFKSVVAQQEEVINNKDKQLTEVKEQLDLYKNDVVQKTKEIQALRTQVANVKNDAQGMESRIAELTNANAKVNLWKYVAVGVSILLLIAICVMVA